MEFAIEVTEKHFTAFQKHTVKTINKRNRKTKKLPSFFHKQNILYLLILTGIFTVFLLFYTLHVPTLILSIIVFSLFLIHLINTSVLNMMPFADGIVLGNHSLKLKDDGIYEETKNQKSFYSWAAVVSLEEDTINLYIFIDKAMAIVIPKDKLKKEDKIQNVKNFINQKLHH